MPENTVKVDRSTYWGNPWRVGKRPGYRQMRRWEWNFSPEGRAHVCQTADEAVKRFAGCLAFDSYMIGVVKHKLRGKNLACWCPLVDKHGKAVPCHADVLLEIANS